MRKSKYIIGIDEAGRGPLAGPVAVGVVLVPQDFDWRQVPVVGDSKQLSEAKREEIYRNANDLHLAGKLRFAVGMVSARVIDRIGIVPAVNLALSRALTRVSTSAKVLPPQMKDSSSLRRQGLRKEVIIDWDQVMVKLDGGLRAPAHCVQQETIIKGDDKEFVIGLASIMAKVTRDRYMRRVASRPAFTPYDFARHKGYGTKAHRAAISKHGLSPEHRQSFCRNVKCVV